MYMSILILSYILRAPGHHVAPTCRATLDVRLMHGLPWNVQRNVIVLTCARLSLSRCDACDCSVGRPPSTFHELHRAHYLTTHTVNTKETTRRILDATEEPLVPNAAYILVAGMFGSILARNRHLPARLLLPPTTATLAASYFMPKTSANAATFLANVTVGPEERMRMEQRVRDGYARVLDAPVRATRGVVDAYDGAVRAVDAKMDGTYREVLETAGRAVNDAKKSVGLGWLSMSGGNGSVAEANKDAPVMDKDATVIDKKDE